MEKEEFVKLYQEALRFQHAKLAQIVEKMTSHPRETKSQGRLRENMSIMKGINNTINELLRIEKMELNTVNPSQIDFVRNAITN